MRKTLAIGVVAWPIRYVIFAIGAPAWLVIASLTLHGFCYVFFFVAAFIYVDKVAPPDIRASAQSLIAIVALGLGASWAACSPAGARLVHDRRRHELDATCSWYPARSPSSARWRSCCSSARNRGPAAG